MALSTQLAARTRNTTIGARGTLYIQGWQAAAAEFTNEAVQIDRRVQAITDAAAAKIKTAQRADVPVREGTTRDSIENSRVDHPDGYAREIGPTWFVARYLQFGTVRMPRKMDLYAASQPTMNAWLDDMSNVSTL